MFVKLLTIVFFFFSLLSQLPKSSSQVLNFTYNGFTPPLTDISLQGITTVTPNGLLMLTNYTEQRTGHAFYTKPIRFKDSPNGTVSSFSTTFVFAIHSQIPIFSGYGMAFVVAPNASLPDATASQYLGLFNILTNGNDTNHVFAVELDTIGSTEFNDTDDNHVGIDINSMKSVNSSYAGYWNESDMFVGFSSATDYVSEHYVLGWSFRVKGKAPPLTLSKLPKLPRRRRKFEEELEDWETRFGKHRLKYKDLYHATKGFKEKDLLGSGGFGSVYRGVMPKTKKEIAVKRVSNKSRQGLKEFVTEVVSIGRMSHRNLVPLIGYCRRRDELLLVYDYMPNGSLDKYLHNSPEVTLDWKQRIKVINGVASALFYLHEEWEQVVIHRDVKASNVLLDANHNARLGDFGLARLCSHGSDPQTTRVAGTWGYLSPDHIRTGRATTATDVFAFGVLLLEVACGRRPIQIQNEGGERGLLLDWVFEFWSDGNILDAKDPNLGTECDQREVEMILKLGLLCSHSNPQARPSMRQVLNYLSGDDVLPDLSPLEFRGLGIHHGIGELDMFTCGSSMVDSIVSGRR
ncbi:L-type lectin-domain containing receptor kinase IV.4-like isoform X4 [Brassica rapa]|uniref:L-type lectin-domain containing receptor kinase IV.4-like isoform X4 n=1 Tax=Brassica campestris TaxID=3711 RepID=UPI00142E59DC|nr:L-type lectin-domain containing receptor kinase IV.4-like isoform X4 [Brassica rapa]